MEQYGAVKAPVTAYLGLPSEASMPSRVCTPQVEVLSKSVSAVINLHESFPQRPTLMGALGIRICGALLHPRVQEPLRL